MAGKGQVAAFATALVITGGCAAAEVDGAAPGVSAEATSLALEADVTATGAGCPSGSWSADVSSDGLSVTVAMDAYDVALEPDVSSAAVSCQVLIRLSGAEGSFALQSLEQRGHAELAQGVSARSAASPHMLGSASGPERSHSLAGAYTDDYVFQDDVPASELVWSACGAQRELVVPTRASLSNDAALTGEGHMSVERIHVHLAWRGC